MSDNHRLAGGCPLDGGVGRHAHGVGTVFGEHHVLWSSGANPLHANASLRDCTRYTASLGCKAKKVRLSSPYSHHSPEPWFSSVTRKVNTEDSTGTKNPRPVASDHKLPSVGVRTAANTQATNTDNASNEFLFMTPNVRGKGRFAACRKTSP